MPRKRGKNPIEFPKIRHGSVDGRLVAETVPNTDSIASSLSDYEVLPGIREVAMDLFDPKAFFYAADDHKRARRLAEKIEESGWIAPLIVVVDADGPYVLEGAHRYVALHHLKAKSFPAVVVIDTENA